MSSRICIVTSVRLRQGKLKPKNVDNPDHGIAISMSKAMGLTNMFVTCCRPRELNEPNALFNCLGSPNRPGRRCGHVAAYVHVNGIVRF